MPRWKVVVLSSLLGLLASQSVLSQTTFSQWKWRDKSGQTQYSDMPPPPGVSDKDILQRPSPTNRVIAPMAASGAASSASGAAAASGLALKSTDPELEAKRKKIEQDAADKKKADDARNVAIKAENCTRAKAAMRTLDSGMRMSRTNEKGEREILDDTARAAEVKRTQDVMASECAK
jgi:hypothetical protein